MSSAASASSSLKAKWDNRSSASIGSDTSTGGSENPTGPSGPQRPRRPERTQWSRFSSHQHSDDYRQRHRSTERLARCAEHERDPYRETDCASKPAERTNASKPTGTVPADRPTAPLRQRAHLKPTGLGLLHPDHPKLPTHKPARREATNKRMNRRNLQDAEPTKPPDNRRTSNDRNTRARSSALPIGTRRQNRGVPRPLVRTTHRCWRRGDRRRNRDGVRVRSRRHLPRRARVRYWARPDGWRITARPHTEPRALYPRRQDGTNFSLHSSSPRTRHSTEVGTATVESRDQINRPRRVRRRYARPYRSRRRP